MKSQVIIALDYPDTATAIKMVKTIGDAGDYYKVGLELFIAEGYKIIPELKNLGKKVFLDLKIHDIPNTASKSILSCLKYGVDMVNVHAQGGVEMMTACANVVANYPTDHKPLLIAVTLLTSLDKQHLKDFSINQSSEEYVLLLSSKVKESGLAGVVSSAAETQIIKKALGDSFVTVTPGIRLGGDNSDQKRVLSPADAAKLKTDYMVIGRPITESADPKGTLDKILKMIDGAYL